MKTVLHSNSAPAAIGPYSQAIQSGSMVFCSGQIPVDAVTGQVPADVAGQACQSLLNVQAVLASAGYTMDDVVKTTVFLTSMADFTAVNEVYARFFPGAYPARSCVAVSALPKDVRVEIEVIAVKN